MNFTKAIATIVLCFFMVLTSCMVMGSYAVDGALTERSIKNAMSQTDILTQLTEEVLRENTANNGGEYGDAVISIMGTNTMREFMGAYISTAAREQITGREMTEIGQDEFTVAFEEAADEARKDKEIGLTAYEQDIISQEMQTVMPMMTDGINKNMNLFATTRLSDRERRIEKAAGVLLKPEVRYGALGVLGLCFIILIIYLRKSRLGFFWTGISLGISCGAFAYGVKELTERGTGGTYSALRSTVYLMGANGMQLLTIAAGVAAVLLILLCIMLRRRKRKRGKFYNVSETDN